MYVYKYLNKINTFTVRNYYTSWYRYIDKYLLDIFFLKPFVFLIDNWPKLNKWNVT